MDAAVTTWCEGLPLKGTRRIADAEVTWIQAQLAHARRVRWTLDTAGVLVLIGGVAAMFGAAHHFRSTGSDIVIIAFVAFPVALAIAYVCSQYARRWAGRAKSLKADMRAGLVLVFSGDATTGTLSVGSDESGAVTLDVFPSGTVYSVGGRAQARCVTVQIVTTAPAPGPAVWNDQPDAERFRLSDNTSAALSKRRLTEAELRELRAFLDRMKLGYTVAVPVLISVYLGLAGSRYYASGAWWPSPIFACLAAAAMFACGVLLLYWIKPRVAVGKDVRDATVVVVNQEVIGEGDDDVEVYVAEYLEHSRLPWTADGVPAAWRRHRDTGAA